MMSKDSKIHLRTIPTHVNLYNKLQDINFLEQLLQTIKKKTQQSSILRAYRQPKSTH